MTDRPARVLIIAGEASGDQYGALIMQAMAEAAPPGAVSFVGVGGPAMRAAGLETLGDAGALGVTGFLEVLGHLPRIWKAYRSASAVLEDAVRPPDAVILIDYPDFNLRLARRARRAGVPVLYFVAPQVWAWRRGRLRQIAARVDRMLVILPFEESLHRAAGVRADFVGHPLLDFVRVERGRGPTLAALGLDPSRPTVALLPGSRRNELRAHLPPMLGAARLLKDEFRDLQFLLPVSPTLSPREVAAALEAATRGHGAAGRGPAGGPDGLPTLVRDGRYDALAASDAAVVASGTATLEAALLGVPMVIVYRMSPATYALLRLLSRVPHIGMPNLIVGERIVPELVQGACSPAGIATEVRRLLTRPDTAAAMRRDLARVRAKLGPAGAFGRAAAAAWDLVRATPRDRTRRSA